MEIDMTCKFENKDFPYCHCNVCLDHINEFKGFNKEELYIYDGRIVKIKLFCPLNNCKQIFIISCFDTFFKWLSLEEADNKLKEFKKIL